MKKFFLAMLSAILLTLTVFSISGCYQTDPGEMKDLTGTYVLDVYTKKEKSSDETTDMIKTSLTEAYLVITGEDVGYYVFRDKDTDYYAEQVKLTYTYESEESVNIKSIKYEYGYPNDRYGFPGGGEETLGFNMRKKRLEMYHPSITFTVFGNEVGSDSAIKVQYKKIDNSTDLSYVSYKTNRNFSTVLFDLKNLEGVHVGDPKLYDNYYPYIYYYIDLSVKDMTATCYYALKSDCLKQKTDNLAVVYKKENNVGTLTIDGIVYEIYNPVPGNSFSTTFSLPSSEFPENSVTWCMFNRINRENFDIEESADIAIEAYRQSK